MPVTARLSGKFYERFGDDVANELVDWFNAVDTTYQTQLKELNELNWARTKAEIDATRAELRAEMRSQIASLRVQLIAWMFGFWTATVIPIIGVMLALVR